MNPMKNEVSEETKNNLINTINEEISDGIDELFKYHEPTEDDLINYTKIRSSGKILVRTIIECCPMGPDRSAAIRLVREAVMTANASIATKNAAVKVR